MGQGVFGDDTPLGWGITVAYFVGAGVTLLAARRLEGRLARLVCACGALLGALGLNKQLDLQVLVFEAGRRAIAAFDLAAHRDLLSVLFPVLVGLGLFAAALALGLAVRHHVRAMAPMLAGFALYAVFVVLRVALFSHLERVLGWSWLETEATAALELAAIALVAGGAVRASRRERAACEAPPSPA